MVRLILRWISNQTNSSSNTHTHSKDKDKDKDKDKERDKDKDKDTKDGRLFQDKVNQLIVFVFNEFN